MAGARIPARLVRAYLHTTPQGLADVWQRTVLGHLQAATLGYNGHFANGLTALFIASGQDVANVANSAVGVTSSRSLPDGDLYASVTLPSLTVATVGGGTGLGTARECLEMLGCAGAGQRSEAGRDRRRHPAGRRALHGRRPSPAASSWTRTRRTAATAALAGPSPPGPLSRPLPPPSLGEGEKEDGA